MLCLLFLIHNSTLLRKASYWYIVNCPTILTHMCSSGVYFNVISHEIMLTKYAPKPGLSNHLNSYKLIH